MKRSQRTSFSEQISELKQQLSTLKEIVASVKTSLFRDRVTLGVILTFVLFIFRAEVVSLFLPSVPPPNMEAPAETQPDDEQG